MELSDFSCIYVSLLFVVVLYLLSFFIFCVARHNLDSTLCEKFCSYIVSRVDLVGIISLIESIVCYKRKENQKK